jgi:hypothetical protein
MNRPTEMHWTRSILIASLTLLVAAVALTVAARLIDTALPTIIGIGVIVVVLYIAWVFLVHRNRW